MSSVERFRNLADIANCKLAEHGYNFFLSILMSFFIYHLFTIYCLLLSTTVTGTDSVSRIDFRCYGFKTGFAHTVNGFGDFQYSRWRSMTNYFTMLSIGKQKQWRRPAVFISNHIISPNSEFSIFHSHSQKS